jgi:hypothetical protein
MYKADNETLKRLERERSFERSLERRREMMNPARNPSRNPVNQDARKEIVIMPPKLVSVEKPVDDSVKWISFLSNFFRKETDTLRKIIPSDHSIKQVDINSLSSIPFTLQDSVKSYLQLLPEDISSDAIIGGVNKFLKNNTDIELFKMFQLIKDYLENKIREDTEKELNMNADLQQAARKDVANRVLGDWHNKNKSFIAANRNNMSKLYSNFSQNSREKIPFERFSQLLTLN